MRRGKRQHGIRKIIIKEYLKDNPRGWKKIMDHTKIPKPSLFRLLNQLKKDKEIDKKAIDGKWKWVLLKPVKEDRKQKMTKIMKKFYSERLKLLKKLDKLGIYSKKKITEKDMLKAMNSFHNRDRKELTLHGLVEFLFPDGQLIITDETYLKKPIKVVLTADVDLKKAIAEEQKKLKDIDKLGGV